MVIFAAMHNCTTLRRANMLPFELLNSREGIESKNLNPIAPEGSGGLPDSAFVNPQDRGPLTGRMVSTQSAAPDAAMRSTAGKGPWPSATVSMPSLYSLHFGAVPYCAHPRSQNA